MTRRVWVVDEAIFDASTSTVGEPGEPGARFVVTFDSNGNARSVQWLGDEADIAFRDLYALAARYPTAYRAVLRDLLAEVAA